jgi:hypothetical protein
LGLQSNNKNTRPALRHAKIAGIQEFEARFIAQAAKPSGNQLPVIRKAFVQKPTYILYQYSFGLHLLDDPECGGEKVAFVGLAFLFARDRKWRTRKAARDNIRATIGLGVKVRDVALDDIPIGAITPKRSASVGIDLDKRHMLEARLLKA